MASNIKVDIVKPTATNGSLSLKGDSGGSATANGITVDSSGNTSISGDVTFTNDATINSVTVGLGAGAVSTNTAIGYTALNSNTTGTNNAATGYNALNNTTTGYQNTAFGSQALDDQTTGYQNTAIGFRALLRVTTGSNNIGIGVNAGHTGLTPQGIANITTGSNNIVMGNNDHSVAYIKIAWTVTSDARDKTCFQPIPHGLDFVKALKPTEYQFRQGGRDSEATDGKRRYGFLAQDILALEGDSPVIINAEDPENLKYTENHLIPVLVKAMQEQQTIIESQQQQIDALTARLDAAGL